MMQRLAIFFCCFLMGLSCVTAIGAEAEAPSISFRGAILSAPQVTRERLAELKTRGYTAVAIMIEGGDIEQVQAERAAAERITKDDLELCYWVEVARCPELADAHPAWMASQQTHEQWRRHFPNTPRPGENEVVKTYPWVPILSREPFVGQLDRIKALLADVPPASRIFLNDLQGAPSACGCGNPLCRWTSDYGKRRTTVPLGDDASALFVAAIKKNFPTSTVVPVWTSECEKHDGAVDGQCAGVGCYDGICWKAYTRQLTPIDQQCQQIGAFVPYRAFDRDMPIYGEKAGWIRHVVESYQTMPPKHGGQPIAADRLITVLQGWDLTDTDIEQQIAVATKVNVGGFLVAFKKLDQSWKPKVY